MTGDSEGLVHSPTVKISLLRGSWDLVIRVIHKVTIGIFNYNSNEGTYNHS